MIPVARRCQAHYCSFRSLLDALDVHRFSVGAAWVSNDDEQGFLSWASGSFFRAGGCQSSPAIVWPKQWRLAGVG